jgi:phosphoglycolate phosphatase
VVLFDFDGTLVDPRDGLLDSFEHGLAAVGVSVSDKTELLPLVGPPIRYGFSAYLGLVEPSLGVAVAAFREYLATTGVLEYELYDGIRELLDTLRATGRTLALVTSKPLPFVELVVDHVDLDFEFEAIAAASLDGTVAEKSDLVRLALDRLRVDASEAVMVGDREFDILGARAHDVASVGVLWGFGSRPELEAAGADAIVADVPTLAGVLVPPTG